MFALAWAMWRCKRAEVARDSRMKKSVVSIVHTDPLQEKYALASF
ncbi:hypothetical protein WG66_000243 [Moniliophthora roreri]|nr:hypothetical protein WG66_000243 [Moniliophthora roreri]